MDLLERARDLKGMPVDFALSPRLDRELSTVIARLPPHTRHAATVSTEGVRCVEAPRHGAR